MFAHSISTILINIIPIFFLKLAAKSSLQLTFHCESLQRGLLPFVLPGLCDRVAETAHNEGPDQQYSSAGAFPPQSSDSAGPSAARDATSGQQRANEGQGKGNSCNVKCTRRSLVAHFNPTLRRRVRGY